MLSYRPVAVAVAVVVAEEVLATRLLVLRNLERLVDGAEQLLAQVRREVDELAEMLLAVLRRKPSHQVQRAVQARLALKRNKRKVVAKAAVIRSASTTITGIEHSASLTQKWHIGPLIYFGLWPGK